MLNDVLSNINIGNKGIAYIVDEDGSIIDGQKYGGYGQGEKSV